MTGRVPNSAKSRIFTAQIDAFLADNPHATTQAEVVTGTGIPAATVYRHLKRFSIRQRRSAMRKGEIMPVPQPAMPAQRATPASDAAVIDMLLHAAGRKMDLGELADALGWDQGRVSAALGISAPESRNGAHGAPRTWTEVVGAGRPNFPVAMCDGHLWELRPLT